MEFDPTTMDYLSGRRFSNGHRFDLGNRGLAPRRIDRLVELVRGKTVLHVGCCDHLDLIRDKVAQGVYLHQQLCRSARRCIGVDINVEGIALLKELGFDDVYVPDAAPGVEYDLCLLADVIEHVGDAVSFLKSMRRYRFKQITVVTPNVFRLRNMLSTGEWVNTDHRYWFSPYTLSKVMVDAGYRPQSLTLCHGDHVSWRGALAARVLDHFPKYRDTLMLTATP